MVTASEPGILTKFNSQWFLLYQLLIHPPKKKQCLDRSPGSIPEAKRLTGWGGSNSWSADRKESPEVSADTETEGTGLRGLEGWRFCKCGQGWFLGETYRIQLYKWILCIVGRPFLGFRKGWCGGTPKMHYPQKSPLFEKRMLKSKMAKVQRSFHFQINTSNILYK